MFSTLLAIFKVNPYAEISKVMQGVHFILDIFSHEKLVDGVNSRDAAIDSVIQLLQAEKKGAVSPVISQSNLSSIQLPNDV